MEQTYKLGGGLIGFAGDIHNMGITRKTFCKTSVCLPTIEAKRYSQHNLLHPTKLESGEGVLLLSKSVNTAKWGGD